MAAVSNYDWQFIRPLDQTPNIAALAQGNQQIQQGLASMGGAAVGYADALKQRNTDQILNTLMGAQTSGELPQAMQAVQALQQQYGRGYDQSAVRNAIDTRGATLGQRDLQQINLQQAQAAQAAIPQLNEVALAQAKARGVDTSAMQAMAALGIDVTGQINQFAGNAVSDARDSRDYNDRRSDITYDRNYRQQRDAVGDAQWAEGNQRANLSTAAQLAEKYVTPAGSTWGTDAQGNLVQNSTAGVTFGDALPAIMGSLFNAESGGVHRQANGQLTRSPKGALGIAQIMPATAAKPGYGMSPINLQTSSPQQQQQWATEYIGRIADKHGFTPEQAVAAYNAGPGAVQEAIKKGGNNWLSKLPKETQNYVPKVMGGAGQSTTQRASQAVGGGVNQAAMSKTAGNYKSAIADLDAKFNADTAKAQTKGSLAQTGKSVETWAASQRGKDNTFFTNAGDLASMAKKDATFNSLPEDAKVNVLNGAFAKMNDVNAFQYVKDADLQKFINSESKAYKQNRVDQYNQQKKDIFEKSYQEVVQQFQAVGANPPSRASFSQMVDPKAKPATPKPQPKATTTQAVKAVSTAAPRPTVKVDTRQDDYLAKRNAERASRGSDVTKQPVTKQPTKPSSSVTLAKNMSKLNTGSLSQKELDKLIKDYQLR